MAASVNTLRCTVGQIVPIFAAHSAAISGILSATAIGALAASLVARVTVETANARIAHVTVPVAFPVNTVVSAVLATKQTVLPGGAV